MKRTVFAVFLIIVFPVFGREPPNFDVIIKDGTIYDGTGAEPRHVDLAIRGDRIAGIGDFEKAKAKTVIDAKGADEPAVEAVRHWKYRPTLLNGWPVEVATTVEV